MASTEGVPDGEREPGEGSTGHEIVGAPQVQLGRQLTFLRRSHQPIQDVERGEGEPENKYYDRVTLMFGRQRIKEQRQEFDTAMEMFDRDHPGNEALSEDMRRRFELTHDKLMNEESPYTQQMRIGMAVRKTMQQTFLSIKPAEYKDGTKCMYMDMSDAEKKERALTAMGLIQEVRDQRRLRIIRDRSLVAAIREHTTDYPFDLMARYQFLVILTAFCAKAKVEPLEYYTALIVQVANQLETEFPPTLTEGNGAAAIDGTCQDSSTACPDHLLRPAESWRRVDGYEWSSVSSQNRPMVFELECFYCVEHEKSYMVWRDSRVIHVADAMMVMSMRALELVMTEIETWEFRDEVEEDLME